MSDIFSMDFSEHNKEVEQVWKSYYAGTPIRVPMFNGCSERYYMMNPITNPKNISYEQYMNDPKLMFDMQCEFAKYRHFYLPGDHKMGIPENGWTINIDFANYYEAAWYGCEVCFPENEVPYAVPLLNEDNKNLLFEKGIPDPFGGIMQKAKDFYDYFADRADRDTFLGQKITGINPTVGTDGIFTLACELRGAGQLCIDMLEDPDYYEQLMNYLTDAVIVRLKAWRKYIGQPEKTKEVCFADDSIMLISHEAYKEYVLPYHKKMAEALSTMEKPGHFHACGDASRHYKTIRDALHVNSFDTGFPIDHKKTCEELGPDVKVWGGPNIDLVKRGTPAEIFAESKRILESVKPVTKKFIFREANDMPPYTSLENIRALYEACKEYGRFENGV